MEQASNQARHKHYSINSKTHELRTKQLANSNFLN